MARPRKFLQRDAEYRYYVQVYPPEGAASKRLHLLTKDNGRAENIAYVIRPAWQRGDYDECKERRNSLNEALDRSWSEYMHIRDQYDRKDDPEGYAEAVQECEESERINEEFEQPLALTQA